MIRVLLADDHQLVRAGLEQLLGSAGDIEVIGSASGGEEAVALDAALVPEVVLMDLSMPGTDGLAAARRILAQRPEARIVMLTSFSDRARIIEAVDAGALGYLLKDADPDELLRGVRAAARGESPLDPRAARAVLAARVEQQRSVQLSPRERQILRLVADGMLNKQIARHLDIREKTVKAHLTSAFQRIGVSDRTQAALWARRNGLLDAAPAGADD